MTALPILLALALTADPAAAPAAAAAEDAGPQEIVAPAGEPAEAPAAPAAPFVLTGFQPPEAVVAGASVRLGGSSRGLDGGAEFTLRHRGFVGGATVGGATSSDSLRTLGVVAGYGHARGHYRGEVLAGWGVVSDRIDRGALTLTHVGHFRSVQAGLERAVWGGEGWRASLGLAAWWRESFGLADQPSSHAELGAGLKLGVEAGW